MAEKEISLGRLFVQEAVRAGTWGIIFLIIMGMFITSMRQEVKEAIDFSVKRLVSEAYTYATHPGLESRAKELVKKGIDYTITRAADETI